MAPERPVWQQRYRLERRLGKRRGRHTYLAWDLQASEWVVVKLLLLGPDFEWADLKLFEREAQLLQTLSHPAIPQYRDHFQMDFRGGRGLVLVQTYIEAPSLQAWIERGRRFTEEEVRQLAQKLLQVLVYLHELHPPVIHRDLKPSNILLGSDGEVYLVDFGSVQAAAPKDQGSYTVVGSYGYMPLEQFGGRAVPASDLYSLGATLVHLLTGKHPADLPQAGSRILVEQAVRVSPPFQNWLRWLLEPSVADRPVSARQALEALVHLEQQLATVPAGIMTPPRRKPAGSRIQLHRSEGALQVVIPAKRTGALFWLPFTLFWNGMLTLFTVQLFFDPKYSTADLLGFLLPFGGIGLISLGVCLYDLFGREHLQIDAEKIYLRYRLLGWSFRPVPPSWRWDIERLEIVPRPIFTRSNKSQPIEVRPQINIWAGVRKYSLGATIPLEEPEVEWLVSQLGDWLKIPVERRDYSSLAQEYFY